MAENRPEEASGQPDPTDPTRKKGRLRAAYDRANDDLAAQIRPGRGVIGERALKAERALQMPSAGTVISWDQVVLGAPTTSGVIRNV